MVLSSLQEVDSTLPVLPWELQRWQQLILIAASSGNFWFGYFPNDLRIAAAAAAFSAESQKEKQSAEKERRRRK